MSLIQKALVDCILKKYTAQETTLQYISPSTEAKAERLYSALTSIENVLL